MSNLRPILPVIAMLALSPGRIDGEPLKRPGLPLRDEGAEVRLIDGSRLHLTVREEQIEVTTPYGRLTIKLANIQQIEFGRHLSAEAAKKAAAALALIESADDKKRQEGWKLLADLKEFAYPSLRRLERHAEKAVSTRARELVAALQKLIGDEKLKKIDRDVIYTDLSKIVGRVDTLNLRTHTPYFGDVTLRVSDLALLRTGNHQIEDEGPINVQPDPGSLTQFQQYVGRTFYFRVTGNPGGSVWGSDVYTTDSQLSTVAIHAGVIAAGQTGIVKVTIMPGQNGYIGSTRNGVSTSGYGPYPGSYRVSKAGQKEDD